MMVPFLELKREYEAIKPEIQEAVSSVLESGSYILGQPVEYFEREFAAWLGASHAVGVGSGTEALHLALVAGGIKPGDGVLTVPNTAVPTVSAISFAGGRPVFVDVDPASYTMSPSALAEALEGSSPSVNCKAIVVVHLYGHAADMDPIMELAQAYGLKVIEDVAQATGATYKGKKVGTIGDFGCFSFYPTKNLGAYGDGGLVVTHSDKDAETVRMLRNYGEKTKNFNVIEGYNSRLDTIQAAVLTCKLQYLDWWNEIRRNQARLYGELLKERNVELPVEKGYAVHVYHLYVIRTKNRDRLRDRLAGNGIQTAVHYPRPVHLQQAYAHLGYQDGSFPVSERNAREVLSLPLSPFTRQDEIVAVAEAIRLFE
jgi:dTDP-4-amino-4,6-dideoxygalactose transaminase